MAAELLEKRRRKLRDRLLKEHPEMMEYLEESREHRIEKKKKGKYA